ncbi:MAG TPA: RICIN domain-containing protein [Mycobacterium sp.]|nr:RICIN domain-containing protein [Mycobacterium sp.]
MSESRLMDGVRRVVVVAGAAFGVVLLSPGVACAADPVQLKSRLGNWCLDAPNGNNAATMVNPCDGSSKSQRWVFNSAGQIESAAFPGQCLSISGAADNTPVILSSCQAITDNTRWTHQVDAKITSPLGPCLNVFGGVAQPGTPVIAYHGIPNVEDEEWDSVA